MEPMKPMKPMAPMAPMEPMEPMEPWRTPNAWWPKHLGDPDSSGAQNDSRYAYFEKSKRLLVETRGVTTLYDTGEHRIQGFGQQQGASGEISFQSNRGRVELASLKVVEPPGPGAST